MKDEVAQRVSGVGLWPMAWLVVLLWPAMIRAEEQTTGTLSLAHLFGSETLALPTRDTPEEELNQLVAGLDGMLNEEQRPRLLELTERLLTLFHPNDPRWAETLSFRGAAMLRERQHDAFRRISRSYMEAAPRGPRAAWILEQRARLSAAEAQWTDAASDWAASLSLLDDRVTTLPMETILSALESLTRGGKPADAVTLSRRISWVHCSPVETDLAMLWLLDAHLQDEAITAEPPALDSRNDSVLLRRALIALRERRPEDALSIARRIDVRRLSDSEAAVFRRNFDSGAPVISIRNEGADVR